MSQSKFPLFYFFILFYLIYLFILFCFVSAPCTNETMSKMIVERKPQYTDRKPMLRETKNLLEDFYRPHNIAMYELTGDRTFLYEKNTSS